MGTIAASNLALVDPVRLCQENPIGLVSLWDIVRLFNIGGLAESLQWISHWEKISEARVNELAGEEILTQRFVDEVLMPFISRCHQQFSELRLVNSSARLNGQFSTKLCLMGRPTWRTLHTELEFLRDTLHQEFQGSFFSLVHADKKHALEHLDDSALWPMVWGKISAAEEDIRESVYCYVLDRNTACVFHLMRVAEHCLRALARKLRVSLKDRGKGQPLEFAEWNKVITGCKNRIDAASKLPQGPKRAQKLERFSDAADHCLFMKDLFRNNVSHARKPYNDKEAMAIMSRVREFAIFTAGIVGS